ncbi:MAG: hypothetical protein AUG51_22035 [Acidobacteria bacterium 13_1_20CM_3_53_8]|nr:MAG: hypothetical protein AUG51_22035 [Acidobacteria bacterium 13_1_20CM_3_53_8]
MRANPAVDFAEPNYLITADETTPNDPRFSEQWTVGSSNAQAGRGIDAAQAWEQTTGSKNTVIAVIDSGIDFTHPDLVNNEWSNPSVGAGRDPHGWDYVTDNGKITDEQGHGTAVAGIIAAEGNNATGISGVMWHASLMSLRVLDSSGTGDVAHAVEAIDYAVAHGAQVINCSWGTSDSSVALFRAISRASKRGVLVIASAGNDGHEIESAPHYPASFDLDNIIAVASSDRADQLAQWSNWGAMHVLIAAPGVDVLTTHLGGDYQAVNGTSASAALVSGMAGLIRTLRPWLGATTTRQMIMQSARPTPALSGKVSTGGIVGAAGLSGAISTLSPQDGLDSASGYNGGSNPPKVNSSQAVANNGNVVVTGNGAGEQQRLQRFDSGYALPGIGEVRGRKHANPHAPAAIPSTLRSKRKPRAAAGPGGNFHQPPPHRASLNEEPISSSPLGLLAWGQPMEGFQSLFGSGHGVLSDSPFSLFGPKRPVSSFARPAPFQQSSGGSATFVQSDTTTKGSWKGVYGIDGYNVINDSVNYPSYAQVSATGQSSDAVWAQSTSDVRALQKASGSDRIASCWYSSSEFTIDVNVTDGNSHRVTIYNLDWDGAGPRQQRVDVLDAANNTVLDTRSLSNFTNGQYLTWQVTGHIKIRVTYTDPSGLYNAVIGGLFFDPVPLSTAASFVRSDTTTQGNWKGAYGSEGFNIINDSVAYPSYAQVSVTGQSNNAVWATSTSDVRALQKAANNDRLASCWYSSDQFIIDLNITDGRSHYVSIYNLDWDSAGPRQQRIDILSAADNTVLDSRSLSNFTNGQYLTWQLSGHVKIKVTYTDPSGLYNAVISGLFFDSVGGNNSATFIRSDATTQGNWRGVYGSEGYNVVNDSLSYPSYAQVSVTGQSIATWASSTSDARALQKASGSDRIASCWYSSGNFTIDLNLTDGKPHRVTIYNLDWDGAGPRQQRIDILNAADNTVLDTRSLSNFTNGQYLTWQLSGHIKIKVTYTDPSAIYNAVIGGLFFDSVMTVNTGGPYTASVDQLVQFNGLGSRASFGAITSYQWNFGDGSTGTGANPTHTYSSPGTYTVNLIVTDALGSQMSATTAATIQSNAVQPFIIDFFNGVWLRQPNSGEMQYWNDNIEQAYAQSADLRLLPAQEMGRSLFESADYVQRNRDKHWYVYDLYKAYFNREPDQGGWDFWTGRLTDPINPATPEQVRQAFAENTEFVNRVGNLLSGSTIGSTRSNLLLARLYPGNRTGGGGEDLLSRNFNWSVPLVSLPGRAGLDLGLSLSYNSLVWTRSGSYIYFDEDRGEPSPGFRLGFPTIQGQYFNPQTGKSSYLLITPGGSRAELRQVGTGSIYESADSSYLQLDTGNMMLRTADGTQLSYALYNGAYRCTQVKDRNGNYITVNYNQITGQITTVVDTLGRTITFNYDNNANIISISQVWDQGTANQQTHLWATFGWDTLTLQPGFSGLTVVGAYGGETIPVLKWVGFDDQSYTKFTYSSVGQVTRVTHYAADSVSNNGALLNNHALNYTDYTFDSGTEDCPRVSTRNDWAENWNIVNGQATPVTTQYRVDPDGAHVIVVPDRTYMPDGVTLEHDNTEYREYYGAKAWQRGLVVRAEWHSNNSTQKSVVNTWTQGDVQQDEDATIILNPRLTDSTISDAAGNNRRTKIDYQQFTLPSGTKFYLPSDVTEYAANATTELRKTHTDYLNYLDQHILGLANMQTLADGTGTLFSKVDYQYDTAVTTQDPLLRNDGEPVQHDSAYSISFSARGNLTRARRWDANYPNDETKAVAVSRVGYDTAGCTVFTLDALDHRTSIGYADAWYSDTTQHPLTLAYPTQVTVTETVPTTASYSSLMKYNYDRGLAMYAEDPKGAKQETVYDDANRVKQVTNLTNQTNQAHVKWEYPTSQNVINSFTTVEDNQPEAFSAKVLDGDGRVIATASVLPGDAGHYTGQQVIYDTVGRVSKQSNPTETDGVSGGWHAISDDAQLGWLYSSQIYDWKGRPRFTINTDGTQSEASYSGCGCAGGEVVTLTDEGTRDVDGTIKRRQQVVTHDILGRVINSKVLDFNGNVYTTTVNVYNALDQATSVRQYQGAEGSSTYQESTVTYDGYGRPLTKHAPEQDNNKSTSYDYNLDDTVKKITDARGASATYSYNSRHLVIGITYSSPDSTSIPAPSPVSMDYDSAGNRLWMTDGMGRVDYSYDTLSYLRSETRQFSGTGVPSGTYTLSYEYNLSGELKKVTDPTNASISYSHDQMGRVTAITGSSFANVTQYASNMQYRAWGALKGLTYGNNLTLTVGYNTRMQPASFSIPGVISKSYDYHPDGSLSFSHDLLNDHFDRSYSYDNAGRLAHALSGQEARGWAATTDRPYNQSYSYDAFGHITSRTSASWSRTFSMTASYTNNRNQQWQYDSDGNLLNNGEAAYSYDAAGRIASVTTDDVTTLGLDGDGQQVRTTKQWYDESSGHNITSTTYYMRSSVLKGQVVTEIDASGAKTRTFIYGTGGVLAWQRAWYSGGRVVWEHRDVNGESFHTTDQTGQDAPMDAEESAAELDPVGADASLSDPYPPEVINPTPPEGGESLLSYPSFGNPVSQLTTYARDGIALPLEDFMSMVSPYFHSGFGFAAVEADRRASLNNANYRPVHRQVPHSDLWYLDTSAIPLNPSAAFLLKDLQTGPGDEHNNYHQPNAGIVQNFWRKYGKKLSKCIDEVFRGDAGAAKVELAKGLPYLDFSQNSRQLGPLSVTGTDLHQATQASGLPSPWDGYAGTIHIASELRRIPDEVNRIITHETGNILASRVTVTLYGAEDQTRYGDPNGIGHSHNPRDRDADTGAKLELCVFGSIPW